MVNIQHLLPLVSSTVFISACFRKTNRTTPPPETVSNVDLLRYAGTWHEIARYPNRFQEGCYDISTTYTPTGDGRMHVLSRCLTDYGEKRVQGTAKVIDSRTNARLDVSFFQQFYGDYCILGLGEDYEYAVVGTPDRKYLWILSRTPIMEWQLYERILIRVSELGFDPAKLLKNEHIESYFAGTSPLISGFPEQEKQGDYTEKSKPDNPKDVVIGQQSRLAF
jgi:apolipoprotein D and lipocalin family protein